MKIQKQKKTDIEYYYDEGRVISFSHIMFIIARQLKFLIITPIIFCSLGVAYALFFTIPIYTSTAKIMYSSTGGSMSQVAGLASQFGISMSSAQTEQKWAYPEIIKSRTLARSLLSRKFNTNEFGPGKRLQYILTHNKDNPNIDIRIQDIEAVDIFLSMINISEDQKTGIITLRLNAKEPHLAAEINQALIEELDLHQQRYNKAKTRDTKHFIEERITDIEKELIKSEENLKVFNDRNRRIENSPALQLEQQRLGREVTVLTGVFTTLKQQLETTKIEEVKDSDYVIIFDPPEVPLEKSKPNRKNIVLIAGFLGLGFGILIAFFMEFLSNLNKEQNIKLNEFGALLRKNLYNLIPWNLNK